MSTPAPRPELDLVLLLPDRFDVHADSGNARVIASRAAWEGYRARVHAVSSPEEWPERADAVFLGDGDADDPATLARALAPFRERLLEHAVAGRPLVAVGLGRHLLGRTWRDADGGLHHGLGVFSGASARRRQREVGEVASASPYGLLVGFEHRSFDYHPGACEVPLGDADEVDAVGVWSGTALGTDLHGPLLVDNPELAVALLRTIVYERHRVPFVAESENARRADDLAASLRESLRGRVPHAPRPHGPTRISPVWGPL